MKKLIPIFLLLMSSAYSQDYKLSINLKDGSTVTISIDDIQKIDFQNFTGIEDLEQLEQIIRGKGLVCRFTT